MSKTHVLKIVPQFFEEVRNGNKRFEIRKNDRDFHAGDYIILNEWTENRFTGRQIAGRITFITDFEQKEGYVVFCFKPVELAEAYSILKQSQNIVSNDKLFDSIESEISASIRKSMQQVNSFQMKGGTNDSGI